VNAEIVAEMIKLFNITTVIQNVIITAEKIALKAMKICIIYMYYFSVIKTNINFRRQQQMS